MDELTSVDTVSKGGVVHDAMADFVPQRDSLSKQQASSEQIEVSSKKQDVPEFVVDVEKLSPYQDSQQPSYHEHTKSSYEGPVSASSGGTLQGAVSLSVGEGTLSSDGQRPVVPEVELMGGSLGAHEDAFSDYSFGGRSNMSLQAQAFQDNDSAKHRVSQDFTFGAQYSDDGGALVVVGVNSLDVITSVECVDNTRISSAHVCDDEERYSRHASDPGVYAREAQKLSSETCLEGSGSPEVGAVNECMPFNFMAAEKLSVEGVDGKVCSTSRTPSQSQDLDLGYVGISLARVKEWVNSIQLPEVDSCNEESDYFHGASTSVDTTRVETGDTSAVYQTVNPGGANSASLASAAVRSLHPFSTVAHLSGISLREVPSLGVFSSLRSLNLSANLIAHVPVGCLPRSLHTLDLSRNRIAQIEGFRELTRLRVLNLSNNRISRIGHGLANCTLIKELCLAENKIGEVEGLHRLLKLAVLDLSFNKITTQKGLGQLAANYGSLLALNLIGNPILTNFSEDQMRKVVTTLVPQVAYLNRQPIKAISVREAALDSIARAALGTSHRHTKARDSKAGRKPSGTSTTAAKKRLPPHNRASEKKMVSTSSGGHHNHHSKDGKAEGVIPVSLVGVPKNIASHSGKRAISRSRSAGLLHE